MDDQSLRNILFLYRHLRNGPQHQQQETAVAAIGRLVGDKVAGSSILKVAAYLVEQTSLAKIVIDKSRLSPEAKQGILANISGLSRAFSLENINKPWRQSTEDIGGAITNLVILLSSIGVDADITNPDDANALAADVRSMMTKFEDGDIDPDVRDVAARHLQILVVLLENLPIFGIEAAMSIYFEMVVRLRRADIGASEASHSKTSSMFDKIKTWGERLNSIDGVWNAGARLLGHADKAQGLLHYIPHM